MRTQRRRNNNLNSVSKSGGARRGAGGPVPDDIRPQIHVKKLGPGPFYLPPGTHKGAGGQTLTLSSHLIDGSVPGPAPVACLTRFYFI
ncbi:hypothetical protein EVAR_65824_1 [Eumeta japonica]|uniref:Uncharacterized protein n=1 Tax=Eumeta variegata TaxID=151549 RepID=A0A4C1ZJ13_EUMVA|nr:hypothetical protein EVAR_65824_1 [Eumeta japonica]